MLIFDKVGCHYEIVKDDGHDKKYFGSIYIYDGDYIFDHSDVIDSTHEYTKSEIFELADFMKNLKDIKEKKW